MAATPPQVVHETDQLRLWSASSGPYRNNTYLIVDKASGLHAIIDPFFDCVDQWTPTLNSFDTPVENILITHAHIDHVCGVAPLLTEYPEARVHAHKLGVPLMTAQEIATLTGGIDSLETYAQKFNLPAYQPVAPTDFLNLGEPFSIGNSQFEVLSTPGHCSGHIAFVHEDILISGDNIYKGSVGFTTIPQSDPAILADTIVNTLLPLGPQMKIYPGHGAATTIGAEQSTNPFILEALKNSA